MSKRIRHSHQTSPLRKPLLLLAALMGLALPSVGYSLNITVNVSADAPQSPGNTSTCVSTSGGQCTLRAAIQLANITPGKDVITLTSDVSLGISGLFENAGKSGDLDISDSLDIIGSGAVRPTINANNNDRVFHIQNGAKVTLRNLTITGGFLNITSTTPIPKGQLPGGAGILVEGASTLSLESCNLTRNTLIGETSFILTGGGLYIDALAKVTIKDSTFEKNNAPGGGALTNLGSTEIRNTVMTENGGGASNGGAIRNMGGFLNIGNSTIINNNANLGAGISSQDLGLNLGNVIVSNSVITQNNARQYGGGIHNESPLTLTHSTVSKNRSSYDGGGIYNSSLGDMDIINTTISSNVGRSGGGIFNTRAITLTNVTLYNNRSEPCSSCTGSFDVNAPAENGAVGGNQLAIFGRDSGSSPGVTMTNTIIANGIDSNPGTTACSGVTTPINYKTLIHSSGGNLENSNSCGLVPTGTSRTPDIINSSNLGLDTTLAIDSRFPDTMPVHALLPNSDAIDHANSSICPQVDQRFLQRTDGRCDIGAYEYGASIYQANTYVDLKLVMSDNADPVKPNDALSPLTYKVVLTNVYVNASAIGVVLEIKLPSQFSFTKIDTTSTTNQPDCDPNPSGLNIIECRMNTLPGLARVEVFITGNVVGSFDKPTTITAEAGVKSATQDAFLGNNRAKEDTLVDKNADTTLNFGGNNTGGGGGGGALHLPWLLALAALLLARRQRRT